MSDSAHPIPSPSGQEPGHTTGLPGGVLAGERPPRRPIRRTDVALTAFFTAALVALVVVYVTVAVARAADPVYDIDGTALANGLAIVAPIVLGVFSAAFSLLFIRRRIPAFWLPIVAGILVVALYSVTDDMLASAVLGAFTG